MKSSNDKKIPRASRTNNPEGEPRLASGPKPSSPGGERPARAPAESEDTLFGGKLKLYQSRTGYRFSLDAVLLAYYLNPGPSERVADLGAGNGVISVVAAFLYPWANFTCFEVQAKMVERAAKNIRLNGLQDRVDLVQADVRRIAEWAQPESYSAVVANPPYRRLTSGRLSPDEERRIARHEIKGGLNDFIRSGAYLLRMKGKMSLIYPALRSVDLLKIMRELGVEPKRLRMIHSSAWADASLVLVQGVKGGRRGLQVSAPLVLYQKTAVYTAEVAAMLAGIADRDQAARKD